MMRGAALLFVTTLLLCACAGREYKRRVEMKIPLNMTLMHTGIMLKKMGEKPGIRLSMHTNSRGKTVRTFIITSDLAGFTVNRTGTNRTAVTINCRGKKKGDALLGFIGQTALVSQPFDTGLRQRPLPGLYGLHFLSPSFSSLFAGYRNPFADRKSLWGRFLLHLGVDALGTVAAGTEGFRKDFRFNTATLAVLFLHRVVTLPSLTVETDLYNRAVKAGYRLRF